ncbi:MAG: ATP-binding protein [Bifidobacterium psychraerophilum]|uniref:ATP-binding protein n=1 Tax=Bifidobacterium psychraerophilum TaxID=218140 RepID=UPI0039EB2E31
MPVARGSLKVLIGAAPGVGKTYAMLTEGRRLHDMGKDVVIALLETHGRKATAAQSRNLPIIPRRSLSYRGMLLREMDTDAVLRRHPDVALVDELAHSNAPMMSHRKRWEDVQDILEAGIDVITTINVQHIESLSDVVREITGSAQQETVADRFLRSADQVELVDIPPQVLRERLSAGLVYAPDRIDAALSNYFRIGNLTALRELALLWLAGNVEQSLVRYREEQGIKAKWETHERVVVALSGGSEGDMLLRRGARVAARSGGGELLAVHVTSSDGLRSGSVKRLIAQRSLVEKMGGTFHQVVGDDIVESLIDFAEGSNATQIVIGVSSRGSLHRSFGRPSVSKNLVRRAGAIDVHLVTHDNMSRSFALPRLREGLSWKRKILGMVFSLASLPLLTLGLLPVQDSIGMPGIILFNQVLVVLAALIGGTLPSTLAAVISAVTLDYMFMEPTGTIDIYEGHGLVILIMYVLIALTFSYIVGRAESTNRAARRARAESELLTSISGNVLRGKNPLNALVNRTAEAFGFSKVVVKDQHSILVQSERTVDNHGQTDAGMHEQDEGGQEAQAGEDQGVNYALNGGKATLTTYGRDINANDQRLLSTVITQIEAVLNQDDLERKANELEPLTEADKVRTALLNAVSHDLRRPLASTTAAVGGLRDNGEGLSEDDRRELLNVAANGLEELTHLVTDLLDVSRLHEGALPMVLSATDAESVIVASLDELSIGPEQISLDIATVPLVCADPPLLRRAISNLLINAERFNPSGRRIAVSLSEFKSRVEVRVIDYGPGVPDDRKEKIFVPFQRLGDTDNTTGLGLGLALSKGFIEGMGGSLRVEDTPGGGLTMVVSLQTVSPDSVEGQVVTCRSSDEMQPDDAEGLARILDVPSYQRADDAPTGGMPGTDAERQNMDGTIVGTERTDDDTDGESEGPDENTDRG